MKINFDNVSDPAEVRESESSKRPYPGVRLARDCQSRWEAMLSNNGRVFYLGTYSTPEMARQAVLMAQADYLEAKAARYRAEAEQVGLS
jgi:hypothetical protein